ncbi:Peroxisomal N(1)-acetyl-spermine/spermidine oxidase, partial [Frankliniella fusca]
YGVSEIHHHAPREVRMSCPRLLHVGADSSRQQQTSNSQTFTPNLLFSGNAKKKMFSRDPNQQNRYFRMVHGALESGWREANRILRDVKTIPFSWQQKKPKKCSVIIIGAGMAGLGAARELVAAGVTDIVILEAQGGAGGRVCTLPVEASHIELGAQWIHGEDNPIYQIACKQNLLSNTTSHEGLGPYLRLDGTELCSSLVAHVSHKISCILEDCEEFVESTENYPQSVGQYLRDRFQEYLDSCEDDTTQDKLLKWELFHWHLRFQEIDNSCSDLNLLSARDWGKYKFTGGDDCINLSNGYNSVIDALIQDLPDKIIHYNSPVKSVVWEKKVSCNSVASLFPVTVICEDGSSISASHVIVTCSIGFLKANHQTMFQPHLPNSLTSVIEAIGFGVVDKVFLFYNEPWWDSKQQAFQIVRNTGDEIDTKSMQADWWLKDFTGFDVLSHNPAILLAWVGGDGAAYMEELDEDVVGLHCTNLLRKCAKNPEIPLPKFIKRSTWFSNPYIRGGYSHTTSTCDKIGCGPKDLAVPVYTEVGTSKKHPVILLAGEASHESHFSTTHGAFESGQLQARKILNYQRESCLDC